MIFRIFISSVQREFSAERKALAAFIRSDAILSKFFEVFIFEEVPAQDRPVAGVYLDEVDNCDIYLGLHGGEYGNVDKRGVSATQREYERAEKAQKPRICFVRKTGVTDVRQKAFLARIDVDVVRYIEQTGTGAKDMITRCADVNLPRPRWSIEDGNDFKVVIERRQPTQQTTQQTTQQVTQQEDSRKGLAALTKAIADAIRRNPSISVGELMQDFSLSRDGVNYHIRKLKIMTGLRRTSPNQHGVWRWEKRSRF